MIKSGVLPHKPNLIPGNASGTRNKIPLGVSSQVLAALFFILLVVVLPLFYGTVLGAAWADSLAWVVLPPLAIFLVFRSRGAPRSGIAFLFGFWTVVLVGLSFFSEYPFLSYVEFLNFATWTSVLAIALLAARAGAGNIIALSVAISGVIQSFWGLFLFWGSGEVGRGLTGTFGLHNPMAGLLLISLPMGLYFFSKSSGSLVMRAAWGLAVLIQITSFVLTRSRGAWVVAIILVLLALFTLILGQSQRKRVIRGFALTALAGIAAVILIALLDISTLSALKAHFQSIFNRLDYSLQGRFTYWLASFEIFKDNPLIGTGPGTFANAYTRYQQSFVYYSTDPHSFILRILAGQGIVGILFLVAAVYQISRAFCRWLKCDASGLARACLFGVAGLVLHSAIDFDLTYNVNAWLLMMLIAIAASSPRSAVDAGTPGKVTPRSTRIIQANVMVIAGLLLVWIAGVLKAQTPLVYSELKGSPDTPVSRTALNTPVPAIALWERYVSQIPTSSKTTSEKKSAIEEITSSITKFNFNSPRVASAHYLTARLASAYRDEETIENELKTSIELDPHNHPEYYDALSAYLALKGREEASYNVLKECLTEKIPIVSPITPFHVRPTWIQYNPLFGRMWADLAELEEKFGSDELAETYRQRAMLFLSDADSP